LFHILSLYLLDVSSVPLVYLGYLHVTLLTLQTLKKYQTQLVGDPIIKSHLKSLYDNLLEQNLCRIIEPFSRVQVEHVAKLVGLDVVSLLCIQHFYSFDS